METRFPDSCAAKFRPVKPLACGGFGAVWEAVQLGLDRTVAVKIPDAHALATEEERAHFEREARVTALLEHRHVVRVLDWGLDGGAWIAYELLPGPTLRAHLDAGRPTLGAALEIVRQVALALDAAHRTGVIHRDIKPENVMAAGPGWWKVMDFGVARWLASSTRTKTGIILGTPLYISPEQVRGERASAAADLYALGVMLFEMLTGALPHDAPRPIDVLLKRLNEPAPRLADLRPDVPPAVDALVARLLDPDPLVRHASAESLVRELDDALPGSTRALPAPAQDAPTARNDRRGKRSTERSRPLEGGAPAGGASGPQSTASQDTAAPGTATQHPATPSAAESSRIAASSRPDRSRWASSPERSRSAAGPARTSTAPVAHLGASPPPHLLAAAALLAVLGLFAAGMLFVRQRSPVATVARPRPGGPDLPVTPPPSPPRTGSSDPAPAAALAVVSIAALLRNTPAQLRVFPDVTGRRRCALVVPYASADVTLELAAGWRLAKLDGRAQDGAGAVRIGPLAAGLYWVELASAGGSHPGIVRGLAAGPEPPKADPQRPEQEQLYHELVRLAHSRQSWEDEVKLPGPFGSDGSVRALAQGALMLRQAGEIPDAFHLLADPSGKVRLAFEFDAILVRQRADALFVQLERAFAGRAERWDAWHALGWLLANADQRPMGRLALARALEMWPESPWSWAELVRLERRELRELEDAGMPRALLREVQGRARHAFRQALAHSRDLVAAPTMKAYKLDLDTLGRRMREDDARVR